MPITNIKHWDKCVKKNKDPYGACAINVARKVMELLDKNEDFKAIDILCKADKLVHNGRGEMTLFLAGCAANIIADVHSRGAEFREKWNKENQIGNEGEAATKKKTVLNPACITLNT